MHHRKTIYKFLYLNTRFPVEALIWIAALMGLAFYEPVHQEHMTMCFFNALGFKYCPGCGLGRSIAYFFHGQVWNSINAHPLGIPAVFILLFRIIQLLIAYKKRLKL